MSGPVWQGEVEWEWGRRSATNGNFSGHFYTFQLKAASDAWTSSGLRLFALFLTKPVLSRKLLMQRHSAYASEFVLCKLQLSLLSCIVFQKHTKLPVCWMSPCSAAG